MVVPKGVQGALPTTPYIYSKQHANISMHNCMQYCPGPLDEYTAGG